MLRWVRYIDRWVFLSHQYDFDAFFDHTLARLSRHSGIRVIPNGVGPLDASGTSTSFRSAHQIQKDTFVFLCVAYYSRGKDQGFAVRAFQQANIPNSVLVFIGTEFNEWSSKFQNIGEEVADSHKRRRIMWLEKQSRSDTLAAFRESDAFVLSSHLETQPIAILEAMSLGKPWVGRKAGCIASLPGGICVRTPYSMAQAMCSIARNAELRSELSEEGREAVTESFSQQKYAEAYGLLLNELTLQKESPTQP
jgi:glycosyltransferase involved in cell wall biosynthesis